MSDSSSSGKCERCGDKLDHGHKIPYCLFCIEVIEKNRRERHGYVERRGCLGVVLAGIGIGLGTAIGSVWYFC